MSEAKQEVTYDSALLEQALEYGRYHGFSNADWARELGVSPALVSKYFNRKLDFVDHIEDHLRAFFAAHERDTADSHFAWTEPAQAIQYACRAAQRDRAIVPVIARGGMGKTVAVRKYLDQEGRGGKLRYGFVKLIHRMTAREMCEAILLATGSPMHKANRYQMLEEIVRRMKSRHLLVVDDVTHLNPRVNPTALHDLWYIHDRSSCGMVLIGVRTLMLRLLSATGALGEELEQFHSRLARAPIIADRLSEKDVERVARAHAPEIDEASLAILKRDPRTPRNIQHLLRYAMRDLRPGNKGVPLARLIEKAAAEMVGIHAA
jgi:DNA transposition AAA+ family ATPase